MFWAEDKIQKGLVKKAQDGPDLPQWRCAMTLARKGGNPMGFFGVLSMVLVKGGLCSSSLHILFDVFHDADRLWETSQILLIRLPHCRYHLPLLS